MGSNPTYQLNYANVDPVENKVLMQVQLDPALHFIYIFFPHKESYDAIKSWQKMVDFIKSVMK